jgi:antirestriction protein ArdC
VHWTGHTARLNRDLTGRFGDDAYAAEELVAELGAAFACAVLDLTPSARDDHPAYLASWLRILKAGLPAGYLLVGGSVVRVVDDLYGS